MSVSGTKRNEGHEAGARGTVSRAATVVFLGMAVVFTIMAPAMHSDHAVSQNAESV